MKKGIESETPLTSGTIPLVNAQSIPDVTVSSSNVNIWHMEYEGGVGKKILGFAEVVYMLQLRYDDCISDEERTNPQKGVWFYERTAQVRRHFKRQYPEYFAPSTDRTARKKRQERQKEAEETIRDRKRRGRDTSKIPALRSEIVDLQAYRERAGG